MVKRAFKRVEHFYWGQGICDDVPALAYYLLISLAPFMIGFAALAATITDGEQLVADIAAAAAGQLPASLANAIRKLIENTHDRSPLLITVSVLLALWTSSGAVGVVERCMSRIMERDRLIGPKAKLRHLGLAAVMVLSLLIMIGFAAESAGAAHWLKLPVRGVLIPVLAVVLVFSACFLIYHASTPQRVSFMAAFKGALFSALLLPVLPWLVGAYIHTVSTFSPATLFYLVGCLMVSCWGSAFVLLIGAGIASEAPAETQVGS